MIRLLLGIFLNTVLVVVASAQTACPVGVSPGSPQCGPDSGTSRGDAAASPPRPTGEWIKTWGAIARSNSTGEAGSAVGKFSEGEAEQAAIRQCALGGAGDCEVRLSYQNQCAALVSSQSRSFYQSSATEKNAIQLAVKACEATNSGSCKVAYSECSKPIFRKF
ncbi:DUF4189 domain-containing protein [Xanthomonas phaseoli pv. phaseoli]|nr:MULTISPECIES: DUF4189 domain-containing protein [Xanthomonas]ATS21688.1 DUF4189 domain-containing protein [Xanthomonas phaseoli pv. phaseoli]ATS24494.1 DUF4189 domain-containing protein [Xanthomonas phaseoli pv. phaseoli]ATS32811.1 DUF4189 domain-containing protein [Xanthomonas phaseoli pv. phaseoli]MBO9734316.1 DUF4189 domain-containing protein [Xanthomonas phaseoli pv. phaseoli]MBO9743994.1 DUF4189 domain-containing protein [Xanthomonas phaseoli pv. phaseoli]